MSLLEKDKIMLQHRFAEYQRKAEQEAEKRRNLENEGKDNEVLLTYESQFEQSKAPILSLSSNLAKTYCMMDLFTCYQLCYSMHTSI